MRRRPLRWRQRSVRIWTSTMRISTTTSRSARRRPSRRCSSSRRHRRLRRSRRISATSSRRIRSACLQRPRMPRIDELPPQAQREIQAHRGELAAPEPEKQRMSLLKRLASAGLGLKSETEEASGTVRPASDGAPSADAADAAASAGPSDRRSRSGIGLCSARLPQAPQGLDMHGRQAPVNNSAEDDQLEIPAFLRRQAN